MYRLIALMMIMLVACGRSEDSSLRQLDANDSLEKALLGRGYDSLRDRWKFACIDGSSQHLASQTAAIVFDSSAYSHGSEEYFDLNASLNLAKAVASWSPSLAYQAKNIEDDFSLVYSFEARYVFYHHVYEPSLILTPIGEKAFEDHRWYEVCGNEFLAQAIRGAQLRFSLRFDFESINEKKDFSAQFKLDDYLSDFSLSSNFREQIKARNWMVSVSANQMGGKVDLLSTALSGGLDLLRCHSSDIEPCLKVFESLIDYATDPKQFPAQIANNGEDSGVDLKYILSSYDYFLPTSEQNLEELRVIKAAQKKISHFNIRNTSYKNRIEAIAYFQKYSDHEFIDIKALEASVLKNRWLIMDASEKCVEYLESSKSCEQAANRLASEFKQISVDSLSLKALDLIPCAPGYYLKAGYCQERVELE